MTIESFFSTADREAIRAEVARAEERTSGEIVPYVVECCDSYDEAAWKAAALAAIGATLVAAALDLVFEVWGLPRLVWMTVPPAVGAAAGFVLGSRWESLRRWLIPAVTLETRARLRAEAAFLEEEVWKTRERTGVLLFLALFEHQVIVLGDEGINAKVAPEEWKGITDHVVAGIRDGRAAAAMVEAIARCGELMERRQVERRPDDQDELSDRLRLRER